MKRVEIERKYDEIVAFAEVDKFLDTPVKHYSSGMYVRLAFAVAAHLEPESLLVGGRRPRRRIAARLRPEDSARRVAESEDGGTIKVWGNVRMFN